MPGGYKNIKGTDGNTFKKGVVTNPKGRPKGFKGLTETLRDLIESDGTMIVENVYELDENKKETGNIFKLAKIRIPKKDMIVLAALKKSVKGEMRAIEFMFDRMEGMAAQRHIIEGEPIKISYFDENEDDE